MEGVEIRKVQLDTRCYRTEMEKRGICEEYLDGYLSKEALRRKYQIHGKSAILKWLRAYGYLDANRQEPRTSMSDLMEDDYQSLQVRIKQLEEALKQSQLESEAWQKMIEIAEKEYKIAIKKKSNTKQSKK